MVIRMMLLFCSLIFSGFGFAAKLNILYINPSDLNSPFQSELIRFMRATAEDLNIDLQVISTASAGSVFAKSMLQEQVNIKRPDYIIGTIQRRITLDVLQYIEQERIPYFTINSDIVAEEQLLVGSPRQFYKYWLGQMVPNDVDAGYKLASALWSIWKHRNQHEEMVDWVGVSGGRDTSVGFQRNLGLRKRLAEIKSSKLRQVFYTDWSQAYASSITTKIFDRYPSTKIIWAASDELALGVDQAMDYRQQQVLVGGVDWSPQGLRAIQNNQIQASVGGHFMEGGWALILLHDYHFGRDFVDELGGRIETSFSIIDKSNVSDYIDKLTADWHQVDFTRFSKIRTPSLMRYNFSLDALFKAIEEK